MYELHITQTFNTSYQTVIKGNKEFEKRTEKALKLLRNDPFYPSLKSHKLNTRNSGQKWSSWIAGDLRIIWDFDEIEKQILLLFAISKYSGSHREYK